MHNSVHAQWNRRVPLSHHALLRCARTTSLCALGVHFLYMEPQTLQQHIEAKLETGARKDGILEELTAVGWQESEIDAAYAQALIARGVPTPGSHGTGAVGRRASTLDVVLNFFSFILLGIIATALGTLYFQVINHYFPDTLASYGARMSADAVYYAIAALIVAYPLYYYVMRVWFKRFREDEAKLESKLTKWLTYLVLLIASVTIVGDLIAVLFTFFRGEISMRFFLKACTVLGIAGMILGFYVHERKQVQFRQSVARQTLRVFGYVLTGVVLVGILLGFLAAGTPATERMRTFDERRAQDLQQLVHCVTSYVNEFRVLPTSLEDLSTSSVIGQCATTDPETGIAYEYRVLSPLAMSDVGVSRGSFELCATFARDATAEDLQNRYSYLYGSEKWYTHTAGRACDTEVVAVSSDS